MWKCKVCDEKEKRIQDLSSQIEMLRSLAFPQMGKGSVTLEGQELDRILSGSTDPIPVVSPEDRELHLLMAGNYDNSQGDFN